MTLTSIAWKLSGDRAHLTVGRLEAAIDLKQPARGLHGPRWDGQPLDPRTRLLRVRIPPVGDPAGQPALSHHSGAPAMGPRTSAERSGTPSHLDCDSVVLADRYVQGRRLVAVYRASAATPIHTSIVWTTEGGEAAAIGCTVSVWTDLPQAEPAVSMESQLAASVVRRLTDGPDGPFEDIGPAEEPVLRGAGGPGCWLFRLGDAGAEYVQMVYPGDRLQDQLETVGSADPPLVQLGHRLFPETLEKGVILRARVRGEFWPAAGDLQRVAHSYWTFIEGGPPLSG